MNKSWLAQAIGSFHKVFMPLDLFQLNTAWWAREDAEHPYDSGTLPNETRTEIIRRNPTWSIKSLENIAKRCFIVHGQERQNADMSYPNGVKARQLSWKSATDIPEDLDCMLWTITIKCPYVVAYVSEQTLANMLARNNVHKHLTLYADVLPSTLVGVTCCWTDRACVGSDKIDYMAQHEFIASDSRTHPMLALNHELRARWNVSSGSIQRQAQRLKRVYCVGNTIFNGNQPKDSFMETLNMLIFST